MKLSRIAIITILLLVIVDLSKATNPDTRPIAEAWGENAKISSCYSNTEQIG